MQLSYKNHWREQEILLERSHSRDESLGFTIAGGIDSPYGGHLFTDIIVVKIIENGLVHKDEQLRLYDIILRVNNFDFKNIKHDTALEILRTSGHKVNLRIRRLTPSVIQDIDIEQHGKLGITIAGGFGNEHYQNDPGIFIKNKTPNESNERLEIGDRLLRILSASKSYDLRFVTHEDASKLIHLACAESRMIKLFVGHPNVITQVESKTDVVPQGHHESHRSKNKESKVHFANDQTRQSDGYGHRKNEEPFIMKFDHEDYLRYENHRRLFYNRFFNDRSSKSSVALPKQVISNDTNQKTIPELKSRETVISDAKGEKQRRQDSRTGQQSRMNRPDTAGGGERRLRWQVD